MDKQEEFVELCRLGRIKKANNLFDNEINADTIDKGFVYAFRKHLKICHWLSTLKQINVSQFDYYLNQLFLINIKDDIAHNSGKVTDWMLSTSIKTTLSDAVKIEIFSLSSLHGNRKIFEYMLNTENYAIQGHDLCNFARAGDLDMLKKYLESGRQINESISRHMFRNAMKNKNTEIAEYVYGKVPFDLRQHSDETLRTILHFNNNKNNIEIIKWYYKLDFREVNYTNVDLARAIVNTKDYDTNVWFFSNIRTDVTFDTNYPIRSAVYNKNYKLCRWLYYTHKADLFVWDCYLFKRSFEKKEHDFCKWMYYEYNKNYSQIGFNSKKKRDKVDKMFDQIKVFIENDVRNFDFFADMMNELFINHYMYDPNIVNVVIKSYTLY